MFFRGQHIRVIESSLYNKRHPKVGDEGYLRHMFFHPFEYFMYVEMVMFKTHKGPCKPVRKRFLIDLNVQEDELKENGIELGTLVRTPSVNVFADDVNEWGSTYPEIFDTWFILKYGPFHKKFLPFCRIEVLNNTEPLQNKTYEELGAWLTAINPTIATIYEHRHYLLTINLIREHFLKLDRFIETIVHEKYGDRDRKFKDSVRRDIKRINSVAESIRFIETITHQNVMAGLSDAFTTKLNESEDNIRVSLYQNMASGLVKNSPRGDMSMMPSDADVGSYIALLRCIYAISAFAFFRKFSIDRVKLLKKLPVGDRLDIDRHIEKVTIPVIKNIQKDSVRNSVALSRFYGMSFPNLR